MSTKMLNIRMTHEQAQNLAAFGWRAADWYRDQGMPNNAMNASDAASSFAKAFDEAVKDDAGAPDLLESCKLVARAIKTAEEQGGEHSPQLYLDELQAAIAKAQPTA